MCRLAHGAETRSFLAYTVFPTDLAMDLDVAGLLTEKSLLVFFSLWDLFLPSNSNPFGLELTLRNISNNRSNFLAE